MFNLFKSKKTTTEDTQPFVLTALCKGTVKDIQEVSDPAFQSEALGKGVGIIASENELVSPISGTVTVVFPTQHAFGITTKDGVEVLIHIGIDTVNLEGKGFTSSLQQGDTIQRNDPLCTVDFAYIKEQGYDGTIMVVISNTATFTKVQSHTGTLSPSDPIITITK